MKCQICNRAVDYGRRDYICDECRSKMCAKRPSARARPMPPKVSLDDIKRAFEADGGELSDVEQELMARAMGDDKQ